ncbi:MAG: class I SAM-dependent methyltransferase [Candidatus Levybacteria bacterium]|nr:class I SAM-dependent methyltransferase [Candidatus Levybacteria bacterium]
MKKMQWGEDPNFSGPRNWFRETLMLTEILKHKEKGNIIDFGCGSGTLLIRLARLGFNGIGVDISESAINFFKMEILKNKLESKLHVRRADVDVFSKLRDKFEVIIAGEVLEHLKDDKKAIRSFYNALIKGGICVISVPAHMYLWDINDKFSSHFRRYEKKELIDLFSKAGFSVKKIYHWGFPLSFFWHKYAYLTLIEKKISQNKTYSNSSTLFGLILSHHKFKQLFSLPFYFDQLFNWTNLGGGLILVAEK